jgi:hypothetical protein
MLNQAREGFCQGRFPSSLIYVLIVSPWPAVPSTLMPLPSRTALLWKPTVLNIILWLLTAVLVWRFFRTNGRKMLRHMR